MGKIGEGKNPTHQLKKLDTEAVREFRDRFNIPVPDALLDEGAVFQAGRALAGEQISAGTAARIGRVAAATAPAGNGVVRGAALATFQALLEPTAEAREISTTQSFVRFLTQVVRDKTIGPRVVPIIPDERARSAWKGCSGNSASFSQTGQLYEPVDRDQVMYYVKTSRARFSRRNQ